MVGYSLKMIIPLPLEYDIQLNECLKHTNLRGNEVFWALNRVIQQAMNTVKTKWPSVSFCDN